MSPKILCVIAALGEDLVKNEFVALIGVLRQRLPVDMIVIVPKKSSIPFLPERISEIINEGLGHIKIEDFDYILRVDADTFLPSNYVDENLKGYPDIVGSSANGMLLKVSSFQKAMNGRFHPENDDSYTFLKLQSMGFNRVNYRVYRRLLRKSKVNYDRKTQLRMGKQMYQRGFEPLHLLWIVKFRFWYVLGYFLALLKRVKKWDVANFVFSYQIRRLLRL